MTDRDKYPTQETVDVLYWANVLDKLYEAKLIRTACWNPIEHFDDAMLDAVARGLFPQHTTESAAASLRTLGGPQNEKEFSALVCLMVCNQDAIAGRIKEGWRGQ